MLKLFLVNHNFRSYLLFQTFSSIGSGIFSIFLMWVVHSQFQNPFYTGVAGFMFAVSGIASFIVGPFVDKHSKVILIRVVTLVQFGIVGLLYMFPDAFYARVWFLLFAILIYDAALTVGSPAKTALLPTVVDGEDLVKANALIRIIATVVGLGIGYFLYTTMAGSADFELVYMINTIILFIALVMSIFLKSGTEPQKPESAALKGYISELKVGFKFVKRGVVLHLILIFLLTGVFGSVAAVNLPAFAELHSGAASGYILLLALGMVGGVLGSYVARFVGSKFELWKIFVIGLIATGITRIIFVNIIANDFSRALRIVILYSALGSIAGIFYGTLLQKLPPKNIIARVNAINTSLFSIATSIGALLGGLAGTFISDVNNVFIMQGISYIIIGLGMLFSKHLRKLPKINDIVTDAS